LKAVTECSTKGNVGSAKQGAKGEKKGGKQGEGEIHGKFITAALRLENAVEEKGGTGNL